MITLLLFGSLLLVLACFSPHYFFQKSYSYLLGFKEKEVMQQTEKNYVYTAVKPFFWLGAHACLFLQSILFLSVVNNIFNSPLALSSAVVLLFFLLLFIACSYSFRFSYIFVLMAAVVSFFSGFGLLPFIVLTIILFLFVPNLEILVYLTLILQAGFLAFQMDIILVVVLSMVLLLLALFKNYFLSKSTQMDWTLRLFKV